MSEICQPSRTSFYISWKSRGWDGRCEVNTRGSEDRKVGATVGRLTQYNLVFPPFPAHQDD